MVKPIVVEVKQREHMLQAIAGGAGFKGYSRMPERDVALILTLYGTAMTATELATLPVKRYLKPSGEIKLKSQIPIEIAFNGKARPLTWENKRICKAIDAYLAWRLRAVHGATTKTGAYRGLDPDSPIFLNSSGEPYSIDKKLLPSGKISYTSNAMSQLISKLHADTGIVGGSAQSARRTFAVMAARQPANEFRLLELAKILGIGMSSAKRLASLDPKSLSDVVARATGG